MARKNRRKRRPDAIKHCSMAENEHTQSLRQDFASSPNFCAPQEPNTKKAVRQVTALKASQSAAEMPTNNVLPQVDGTETFFLPNNDPKDQLISVHLLSMQKTFATHYAEENRSLQLGYLYLNDLSNIKMLQIENLMSCSVFVTLNADITQPFAASRCIYQMENENVTNIHHQITSTHAMKLDDQNYNHTHAAIVKPSAVALLSLTYSYLVKGFNELFNCVDKVESLILEPHEIKRIYVCFCARLQLEKDRFGSKLHANSTYSSQLPIQDKSQLMRKSNHQTLGETDSSDEETMQLQTSCYQLCGELILGATLYGNSAGTDAKGQELRFPIQGQACQSLLRMDVKELHFDDCVPGKSYVKDFTIWNCSEIPLLFKLVSSHTTFEETKSLLKILDYNTDYDIGDNAVQVAAYGHVRIRVMYRPVGERSFEIQIQNLHDSRNVRTLKVHTVANKEQHREGLLIRVPGGSCLSSGSKLDFGDCYNGLPTYKALLLRNTIENVLQVELSSDRPNEISFELKLQPNRVRSTQSLQPEQYATSLTELTGGALHNEDFSFRSIKKLLLDIKNSTSLGSDEECDDNETCSFEDELSRSKRPLSGEITSGEVDDLDDDFEFDRESSSTNGPAGAMRLHATGLDTAKPTSLKVAQATYPIAYESGGDSQDWCSPLEDKPDSKNGRQVSSSSKNGIGKSNYLVEMIDLPPGVERTILVWYCPVSFSASTSDVTKINSVPDNVDTRNCRLAKQAFRLSFCCFQISGSWQETQSRVHDTSLGKFIHVRARTCTSIVTVSPSILHLGDCNIGELTSGSCVIRNHAELSTIVKPIVTSKVISTVPNEEMMIGPKQSIELKVEIIPRRMNANYSRLISIVNLRNQSNAPNVCVRSSNMDAYDVIYHSRFYKLITQSGSVFLNFDCVVMNSEWVQVFDLENITKDVLSLTLRASDPSKVKLYSLQSIMQPSEADEKVESMERASKEKEQLVAKQPRPSISLGAVFHAVVAAEKLGTLCANPGQTNAIPRSNHRIVRRRRSFGSIKEINGCSKSKRNTATFGRGIFGKLSAATNKQLNSGETASVITLHDQKSHHTDNKSSEAAENLIKDENAETAATQTGSESTETANAMDELNSLLELFDRSRTDCELYCRGNVTSPEKEQEIVAMACERSRRLQSAIMEGKLQVIPQKEEDNLRIPATKRQRIVAIFEPSFELEASLTSQTSLSKQTQDYSKLWLEKHKILITLPSDRTPDAHTLKEPLSDPSIPNSYFNTKPLVRELLIRSRVGRSILNVNQKNINFGRMTTSSKSSKKLVVQNMTALPLIYRVEKTGSISSYFLEFKSGEVGVIKAFGSREICFQFQPSLPGPFEEKLKIVNVQDSENYVSVTMKAKVAKPETFKVSYNEQKLSFGKCCLETKSEEVVIRVRNTSRKRRDYVLQTDPATCFSVASLSSTLFFHMNDAPSADLTQAQEKRLDEELEKLEHKLRIATTKKKNDKIARIQSKIKELTALMNGEQAISNLDERDGSFSEKIGTMELYDSLNSESDYSDSECALCSQKRSSSLFMKSLKCDKCKQNGHEHKDGSIYAQTESAESVNKFFFSLDSEAVARIHIRALFERVSEGYPERQSQELYKNETSAEVSGALPLTNSPHQRPYRGRIGKRHYRKDSILTCGHGKILLYEQQNKDVVKELVYLADIYRGNPIDEGVHKSTPVKAPLPPVSNSFRTKRDPVSKQTVLSQSRLRQAIDTKCGHGHKSQIPSDMSPTKIFVRVQEDDFMALVTGSNLLIPLEESPVSARGWTLALQAPQLNALATSSALVEASWRPIDVFKNLLELSYHPLTSSHNLETLRNEEKNVDSMLPHIFVISAQKPKKVRLCWKYASVAGYAPSTILSTAISRSLHERICKSSEVKAGSLWFRVLSESNTTSITKASGPHTAKNESNQYRSIDVYVGKAIQGRLQVDKQHIELGEKQHNITYYGEFVLHNRSTDSVEFILLAKTHYKNTEPTKRIAQCHDDDPMMTPPNEKLSCLTFPQSTGRLKGGGCVTLKFAYMASNLGKQEEHIVVRNLCDRIDSAQITVSVHVIRPVYVRIPELDAEYTGRLDVLDFGHFYIIPEAHELVSESPCRSAKFSKVRRLTLHSQVEQTLILCATSNLKTQCYIFEDENLQKQASHIAVEGMKTVDLYIAIRPRIPVDALRSGTVREIVGGIRVQIFEQSDSPKTISPEVNNRSNMVAEFTIKFIGLAGASMFEVSKQLINFGTEKRYSKYKLSLAHHGEFDIINTSKGLPLQYRLIPSGDQGGYSDHDTSLEIKLHVTEGEISPSQVNTVSFTVVAHTTGFFRREIRVLNVQSPDCVLAVELILFVDSGAIRTRVGARNDKTTRRKLDTQNCVNFGIVYVVRKHPEVTDEVSLTEESASPSTQYRILDHGYKPSVIETRIFGSSLGRVIVLSNTSSRPLWVRPLSSLPLIFQSGLTESSASRSRASLAFCSDESAQADIQRKHISVVSSSKMHVGQVIVLQPNKEVYLSIRFAQNIVLSAETSRVIEAGRLYRISGMLMIQSCGTYSNKNQSPPSKSGQVKAVESSILKVLNLEGFFGEPKLKLQDECISLGKFGPVIQWKSSDFGVPIRNTSEITVFYALEYDASLISIKSARNGKALPLSEFDTMATKEIVSLQALAIRACIKSQARKLCIWELKAAQETHITFQLNRNEALVPGDYVFGIRIMNLLNPSNQQIISVKASILAEYLELVMDPENMNESIDTCTSTVVCLPPITIPPKRDTHSGHGCNFWFSIKNVYDLDLDIMIKCRPKTMFAGILDFMIYSRSSNTLLDSLHLKPDEVTDVRVVCRLSSSARLPSNISEKCAVEDDITSAISDLFDLGKVYLEMKPKASSCGSEKREIQIRGRILRGRTLSTSVSALHFYAVPIQETDPDIESRSLLMQATLLDSTNESNDVGFSGAKMDGSPYALRHKQESFWLSSLSESDSVRFMIDSYPIYSSGYRFHAGLNAESVHKTYEYVQAIPTPRSGSIAPLGSLKISVTLEQVSADTAMQLLPETEISSGDARHAYELSGHQIMMQSQLRALRHHPTWRSNSWGADYTASEKRVPATFLQLKMIVRDVDEGGKSLIGMGCEVDIHVVVQARQSTDGISPSCESALSSERESGEDSFKVSNQAFSKEQVGGHLKTNPRPEKSAIVLPLGTTDVVKQLTSSHEELDHEDFDNANVLSCQSSQIASWNAQLELRGCTPVANSKLEHTRYVIDLGQHTVRNGGEIEWEITIECAYDVSGKMGTNTLEPVEFQLRMVDVQARSWLHFSRDRGTLTQACAYQTVVLRFLRDAVGVYSTYVVLQNLTNAADLKIIHVCFEVVTDLNLLRSLSSALLNGNDGDPNLFRVLVSQQYHNPTKRKNRMHDFSRDEAQDEEEGSDAKLQILVVEYGEVYYYKLYHNHSIVLENASDLHLDFMLSSNARPAELSFSVSPTSFKEISTVTLPAHARVQVFLHFRPQPQNESLDNLDPENRSGQRKSINSEEWTREIEMYVSCRLVRDFRETVILRALCKPPQLLVFVSNDDITIDNNGNYDHQLATLESRSTTHATLKQHSDSRRKSFLGIVFAVPDAFSWTLETAMNVAAQGGKAVGIDAERFLVVQNTSADKVGKIAVRNNSLFFRVSMVHLLQNGVKRTMVSGKKISGHLDRPPLTLLLPPLATVVLCVQPDFESLWKHRQLWDHSIKEHIALYNINQFAEHYHITTCFSCSNIATYCIPPSVSESYPLSALEDSIAQFLQQYQKIWQLALVQFGDIEKANSSNVYDPNATDTSALDRTPSMQTPTKARSIVIASTSRLAAILERLNAHLESFQRANELASSPEIKEANFEDSMAIRPESQMDISASFRRLYFDFYYITDELVWYGVRREGGRTRVLMLANLVYSTVFSHEIFQTFATFYAITCGASNCEGNPIQGYCLLSQSKLPKSCNIALPTILKPWIQQLGHFLSFFPEDQSATKSLRTLYDQLWRI
uniref:Uncharacterized protein AlNc14C45G3681 n=1 Tax=Albugo laibachii Nc14 TaxID=890382 RepID=F0WAF4_9STRA|nr:conserved hypothetical protein [Albugo laibachii Nc14]|eukprot:CCA18125.1 conserved hypothetical protein [Albugo laibachii Nc14]